MKLLNGIYDHQVLDSIAAGLRDKRLSLFPSLLPKLKKSHIKILDVVGRAVYWESAGFLDPSLLNV
jgi:hypothetical protein